jgi:hypothetical protein
MVRIQEGRVTITGGATWQEVAADAQRYRDTTIARVEPAIPDVPSELPLNVSGLPAQLLSPKENEITTLTTEQLIPKLAAGELSAVEVSKAFLRRAGLAQKLVCIHLPLIVRLVLTSRTRR